MQDTFKDFEQFVKTLAPTAKVAPGIAVRVALHGSETVSADMPLFVGWATAPSGPGGEVKAHA